MSLNEMFGSSDSEVDSGPEDDTRGNPTKVEQESDADAEQNIEELPSTQAHSDTEAEQNIEELPSTQAHMQELFGDSDEDSNEVNTEQQQQQQQHADADQSSSEEERNRSDDDEEMASEDDTAQEDSRLPENGDARVDSMHKQEVESDADSEPEEACEERMDSDAEEPKQEQADSDNEPQAADGDSDSEHANSLEMTLEKSPAHLGSDADGSDRDVASPTVDEVPQAEDRRAEERRQRVISESEASSDDDENRVHEKLVVEDENRAEEEAQEDFEKAMMGIEEDADANDQVEDFSMKALPTAEDLFGEGLDVSSEEDDDEMSVDESSSKREAEREDTAALESAAPVVDGEAPVEEEEGVSIEIELPKCAMRLSKDMYFIKLPNFLSVETKPFDAAFYEDEIDEDEVLDEEGRARLKLKVENTMRWRYGKDKDGVEIKESNSRIVKWSDGSLSLHLGNEIFDILKLPIQGEQNHLFVQQGTGLQAQAVFKDKLSFRPHSTASQTHRKMTLSIAERMAKAQKIRMMPATERDPESQRHEMETRENERLRSVQTREGAQRRMREKNQMKAAGGMSRDYLEEDAAEDGDLEESLAAIKDKYKKDVRAARESPADIYSSDSSDGGSDTEAPDTAAANKSKPEQEQAAMLDIKSDEDELPAAVDDDVDDDEDDEDDDEKITTDRKKTGRKIIEDSDDDDSG